MNYFHFKHIGARKEKNHKRVKKVGQTSEKQLFIKKTVQVGQ